MDPADQQRTLASQGALLGQQEQSIQLLLDNIAVMARAVSELSQQMARLVISGTSSPPAAGSAATVSSTLPKDSHACDPEPFDGDLDKWSGQRRQVHALTFVLSLSSLMSSWSVFKGFLTDRITQAMPRTVFLCFVREPALWQNTRSSSGRWRGTPGGMSRRSRVRSIGV